MLEGTLSLVGKRRSNGFSPNFQSMDLVIRFRRPDSLLVELLRRKYPLRESQPSFGLTSHRT